MSRPISAQQGSKDGDHQRHNHHPRHMSRRYRLFYRDDSKSSHTNVHAVNKAPAKENKDKPKFCKYHKSKTHDRNECTMLKREIDEKQLVGNIVDIKKDLMEKFNEDKHHPKQQKD